MAWPMLSQRAARTTAGMAKRASPRQLISVPTNGNTAPITRLISPVRWASSTMKMTAAKTFPTR